MLLVKTPTTAENKLNIQLILPDGCNHIFYFRLPTGFSAVYAVPKLFRELESAAFMDSLTVIMLLVKTPKWRNGGNNGGIMRKRCRRKYVVISV
jgi:hypothetical protein